LGVSSELSSFDVLEINDTSFVRVVYKGAVCGLCFGPRRVAVVLQTGDGSLTVCMTAREMAEQASTLAIAFSVLGTGHSCTGENWWQTVRVTLASFFP
jgi:hypothetical protein